MLDLSRHPTKTNWQLVWRCLICATTPSQTITILLLQLGPHGSKQAITTKDYEFIYIDRKFSI